MLPGIKSWDCPRVPPKKLSGHKNVYLRVDMIWPSVGLTWWSWLCICHIVGGLKCFYLKINDNSFYFDILKHAYVWTYFTIPKLTCKHILLSHIIPRDAYISAFFIIQMCLYIIALNHLYCGNMYFMRKRMKKICMYPRIFVRINECLLHSLVFSRQCLQTFKIAYIKSYFVKLLCLCLSPLRDAFN